MLTTSGSHDRQPRCRGCHIVTTDNQPIFPDRSKDIILDGPDQLWVADLTYVAISGSFAYVAIILDAWSCRIVGHAIGKSIDARLALAALKVAIARRRLRPGCIHHSDRRSQYASGIYQGLLTSHDLVGSMSRRGNPYDNAKAESFMKTLTVEAIYPTAFETSMKSPNSFPGSSTTFAINAASFCAQLHQPRPVRGTTYPAHGQISSLILSGSRGVVERPPSIDMHHLAKWHGEGPPCERSSNMNTRFIQHEHVSLA